ncbi:MAG: bifunctional UDP-N-acetylglucosamine diphosphorylase/glucosamine-1-phosphate N-acetyltransferase GlmU [Alphaproteobacteria bacterium]
MAKQTALAVILAAGEGTRMLSSRAKVLHEIAGMPMLGHVLAAARKAGINRRAVVLGADGDAIDSYVTKVDPSVALHRQSRRLGTAHAVLAARASIATKPDQVIVLYGDTPFVSPATLRKMRRRLTQGADVVVLGFRPNDPTGYGRLLVEGRRLVAIHEETDATAEEKKVGLCNAGIMGFAGAGLLNALKRIGSDNAKGEFYLTDMVEMVNARGGRVVAMEVDENEVLGVDSRMDLAVAEGIFQARVRQTAMQAGATLIAPETVWFSHDTVLGRDVVVEPNVFFGPAVKIGDGVTIKANSHIVGATIRDGAVIGPFARLRPGAVVGEAAKIGNFVEVKNADIGRGAKVNHLSYVGDASVGARSNIGAGTVTCNYDGFDKHQTAIGEGAFIGSNTSLIAPVSIGADAYVGSGSVITRNVTGGALALSRARQEEKPGWVRKLRQRARRDRNRMERKKD